MTHDDALEQAAMSAVRLGRALAMFQNDIDALARVTPKCACGWAEGHVGLCRLVRGET